MSPFQVMKKFINVYGLETTLTCLIDVLRDRAAEPPEAYEQKTIDGLVDVLSTYRSRYGAEESK